ncbi:MAG: lipoyl(octanoyl) transferase [Lentisphaeria bacterium]|jgi:lipoyl(octanoyl) transferase
MRSFTNDRTATTCDELWLVEHPAVYTQGQAGKAEHILVPNTIPLVQSDRGGQVTYHGPGQLVAYPLVDLKRMKLGVRELVNKIEHSVVVFLRSFGLDGSPKADAPGVYVAGKKIASLGLRVRKSCSYHGVAININADLAPFTNINPCGYEGLEMVNLVDLLPSCVPRESVSVSTVAAVYAEILAAELNLTLKHGHF